MKSTIGTILSVSLPLVIASGCASQPRKVPDPPSPIDKLTILFTAGKPQTDALRVEPRIPTGCTEQKDEGKSAYEAKLEASMARETAYVCEKATPDKLAKFAEILVDITHGRLGTPVAWAPQAVKTASLQPVLVAATDTPTGASMTATTSSCSWGCCKWTNVCRYWISTCNYPC
jgi:hypothetical protein